MADDPASPVSQRARERAEGILRRAKRAERREACFDLLVSGFSPHEMAKAMKMSPATARRLIDQSIRERRLSAPEDYAHIQVARLSKALAAVDQRIEQGDIRAVPTLVKLVGALDRYHGLGARQPVLPPASRCETLPAPPASPLALAPPLAAPAAADDLA